MNLTRYNPLTLAGKLTGRTQASGTFHFFKDSFFYSIASVLPRALSFLIWPLIVLYVKPDGYAIFNNYNSAISVLIILVSLQVDQSIARYYYEGKEDFPDFLGTQMLFTTALAAIMSAQVWIFRDFWARTLSVPTGVLLLALAAAVVQITQTIYFQILLARKRSLSYLKYNTLQNIFYVALVWMLLSFFADSRLYRDQHYLALVHANLFSFLPLGLVFLFFLVRMARPVFKPHHLIYALHLTLPSIGASLARAGLNYFDGVYISNHSLNLAGQYRFAYQLGLMIQLASTGIFSAYMPRFYEQRKLENYGEIQTMFRRNLKLLLLGASALIIMSGPVAKLLSYRNPDYLGSISVVPIVVTGYVFMWLGQCYGLYTTFRRRYLVSHSLTLVLALVINIGLNVWLLPIFNYNTKVAAINTVIPLAAQWLMVYFIVRVLLRERTINFKGLLLPFAAYLTLATLWSLFAY